LKKIFIADTNQSKKYEKESNKANISEGAVLP